MPQQTPTPRDVARHVLDELNELRTFVDEHAPDDPPQWRNLEDLLRLAATEAARVYLGLGMDHERPGAEDDPPDAGVGR